MLLHGQPARFRRTNRVADVNGLIIGVLAHGALLGVRLVYGTRELHLHLGRTRTLVVGTVTHLREGYPEAGALVHTTHGGLHVRAV